MIANVARREIDISVSVENVAVLIVKNPSHTAITKGFKKFSKKPYSPMEIRVLIFGFSKVSGVFFGLNIYGVPRYRSNIAPP
ncbi:MAG: hypothetical protein ACJA1Z_002434 [Patiriisocius sp.]|jgi:hypothetical protein